MQYCNDLHKVLVAPRNSSVTHSYECKDWPRVLFLPTSRVYVGHQVCTGRGKCVISLLFAILGYGVILQKRRNLKQIVEYRPVSETVELAPCIRATYLLNSPGRSYGGFWMISSGNDFSLHPCVLIWTKPRVRQVRLLHSLLTS